MVNLGAPEGIFRLSDSDRSIGSFLTREDVKMILGTSDEALEGLPFRTVYGEKVVNENDLHKRLKDLPLEVDEKTLKRMSLDELILGAICRATFPGSVIKHQVAVVHPKTGRKNHLDLQLKVPNRDPIFIEFDGPSHFKNTGFGPPDPDPFARGSSLEDASQMEVVHWPYWILRCETNLRALFDPSMTGIGALWSTTVHFGDFTVDRPASVIERMTARFNAVGNTGYGYFYEENARGAVKPAHPIIEKIARGDSKRETIIPHDAEDPKRWLPDELKG